MSDIIKKNINGNEYLFINHSRSNRSGFVHETELFKNNSLIAEDKIQYYNRTWECYRYQTVMRSVISRLTENLKDNFISNWKENHGIKRLTETKRKLMEEDFKNNTPEFYAELEELYSLL